jgi:hypothetical protein
MYFLAMSAGLRRFSKLPIVLLVGMVGTGGCFAAGDDAEISPSTSPNVVCPGGAPIADADFRVKSPRKSTEVSPTDEALPLKTINRLEEGDVVTYSPIETKITKIHGDVALVLVPARHGADEDPLMVLEPKPATKPQEWTIPMKTSIVLVVYGPSGFSRGKVKKFLLKDDTLVVQLADYAEKTAQTEALLAALSSAETAGAPVDAAVSGFASQYGLNVKFDPHATADQQAMTLFSTLNPAMGGYDPIAPQNTQRIAGAASLATSVATLFLGSPVGLVAGGTAMALQLRALAFPHAEFRSAFVQPMASEAVAMCGSRAPAAAHTQVAYLWATRVPNANAPAIHIGAENTLAIGQKSPLSIGANESDWKLLDRARHWRLVSDDEKTSFAIPLHRALTGKVLDVDLTGVKVPEGEYVLKANWDWDSFAAHGHVGVRPSGDVKLAHLASESQDVLIAKAGKIPVTLEGTDFEFVNKVQLEKVGDRFGGAEGVPFVLPKGPRQGPQTKLDVQVNTIDLDPGDYRLVIAQVDGSSHPVEVKVVPIPPRIVNLPLLVNAGEAKKEVTITGEHLDTVERIEMTNGKVELGSGDAGARQVVVHLDPGATAGSKQDLKFYVKDRAQPVVMAQAVQVVGPRPKILESKISAPEGMDITLHNGELPSGYFLSTMLKVRNLDPGSAVKLSCAAEGSAEVKVRVGEQSSAASLQQLSADQLFLSFDSSAWPSGCLVTARVDEGDSGVSEPFQIGRIIRVPKIESFKLTTEAAGDGFYVGVLTGQNLETIERAGWDVQRGNGVLGLPTPLPGEGQKQSLKIKMPWPSPAPHAPLFIWLRGARQALTTTVHE